MTSPFALAEARTPWPSDRWGTLVCRAAWDETADVRTFLLAPDDGSTIPFEPGQFITVRTALEGGGTAERCYTLSSSAAAERSVTITVKRIAGGAVSNRLHETLAPGRTVEAFGPSGSFGPAGVPERPYLLISAGCGITPMLSILRTAADLGVDLDAVFVHAARTPGDLIAADDIAPLRRRLPRLRVHTVLSRPDEGWAGERGRLDAARLADLVPDLAERTVFTCGPEGFMAAMRDACAAAGVPRARYHEESFDFAAVADALAVPEDLVARRITFARSAKSFDCPPGYTILQAARLAGIPMPSSCARGVCGTCKCGKVRGEVRMSHGGGIRQREVDRGLILPCSSYPESDVVLDR